jgi:hypothetical protein
MKGKDMCHQEDEDVLMDKAIGEGPSCIYPLGGNIQGIRHMV